MSIDLTPFVWGIVGALLIKLLSSLRAPSRLAVAMQDDFARWMRERASGTLTPDWYVLDMGDGGAVPGLVDEVTVGGAPWLRVRHPHPREGFTGTSRYPLCDVRAIDCATEDECRGYARASEDEQGVAMPATVREPVGTNKAN